MTNLFYAKSVNSELVFDNQKAIKEYLFSVNNKTLKVNIDKEYGVRSLDQNSWLWAGVYKPIADYTGNTETELHEVFKRMFLPPRFIKYRGKEIKIPNSTTKLNKLEFGDFVERIRVEVGQMGITIPEIPPELRKKKTKKEHDDYVDDMYKGLEKPSGESKF
jgi:hypothetical protein